MASLDFNKIKRWVFFILSAWALLAFIAWHYESTCGMFLSGACLAELWDGARHVVLLRWVKSNEALLVGVMTLLGGCAVIAAAWLNIKHTRQIEKEKKRTASKNVCHIISAEFQIAASALSPLFNQVNRHDVRNFNFFEYANPNKHHTYLISPLLGHTISIVKLQADKALLDLPQPNPYASAQCYAVWHLLFQLGNNLGEDGTFNLEANGTIPVGILLDTITKIGVARSQIGALEEYFNWERFD